MAIDSGLAQDSPSPKRICPFVLRAGFIHAVFLAGLFAFVLLEIPTYEAVFAGCGVRMPVVTEATVVMSHCLWRNLALAGGVMGALILADVGILHLLRRAHASWGRAWGWLVALVLVALISGVFLAVNITLAAMVQIPDKAL